MKDEKLDSLFRDSIADLDGLPPQVPNWDMDGTFAKIQSGLEKQENRRFPGIFDMAAAITAILLVTGTFSSYLLNQYAPKAEGGSSLGNLSESIAKQEEKKNLDFSDLVETFIYQPAPNDVSQVSTQNVTFKSIQNTPIIDIKSKEHSLFETASLKSNNIVFEPSNLGDQNNHIVAKGLKFSLPVSNLFEKNTEDIFAQVGFDNQKSSIPKFEVSLPVGIAMANQEPGAFIAAKFSYQKVNQIRPKVNIASATISNYGLIGEDSDGNSSFSNNVFLEASFGNRNLDSSKTISGHEFGVGILLNPNNSSFDSKALKINYSLNIKNKVNISPEIILTEGLSRAIAGFKLSLG